MTGIQTEDDAKFVAEMIRSGKLEGERKEAAFAALEAFRSPQQVGGIDVDTSPVQLPDPRPPQTFGVEGGIIPPFTTSIDRFSAEQRADAARGVDVKSELKDFNLRKAIGFSPNEAFTADFLATKLAEQTGLPAEKVVKFNERNEIEFFNPQTRRFTPVDSRNFTTSDLADIYGPGTSIGPALVGSIAGGVFGTAVTPGAGTFVGVTAGGGLGAWLGEITRLQHGKSIGVHNLSNEEIFNAANKVAAFDVAAGTAGQLTVKLRSLYKQIIRPKGFSGEEAEGILKAAGTHQGTVDEINEILQRAGSKRRFKLDPVAEAESPLGLERREAAARVDDVARAQRSAEMKANNSALDEAARVISGIRDLEASIITNEGTEAVATPVQRALRVERQRIQAIADKNLLQAEQDAIDSLAPFRLMTSKQADKAAGGFEARQMFATHEGVLRETKTNFYNGYQRSIGQAIDGDEGFSEALRFTSGVKVPITRDISVAHNSINKMKKESLITSKGAGPKPLKGPKPTTITKTDSPIMGLDGKPLTSKTVTKVNTIDLAVLDDDIKTVRNLLRKSDGKFSAQRLKESERLLVRLRNDYLKDNNPDALDLLEKAEKATKIHSDFVSEGAFSAMLKTTATGKYVLDEVDVFRRVFQAESVEPMRELVKIAAKKPGGIAALQATMMKFYKANVIPDGSNVPSRALHDKFVSDHAQQLKMLFKDPSLHSFGRLESNVLRTARIAERVNTTLARSPLGKLAGVFPENMGKKVFTDSISSSNIRSTMNVLEVAGPEMSQAFKDSVGREVYRRVATGGEFNVRALMTLLETNADKLTTVFGGQYVRNLEALGKGVLLNQMTSAGPGTPTSSLIGMFARSLVTPPLTRRGRFQTFIERYRHDAANRALNAAVRDPDILHSIVVNANKDVRNARIANILSQVGATSLVLEEQQ